VNRHLAGVFGFYDHHARETEGAKPVNACPARSAGALEGPALLARLRGRLLDQVLGLLEADPAVDGVALVGSLGRGEEDNWSDIDLLILASDQFIRQLMNEPAASPWARADLLSDGRHNSPAGATSLGTTHIRSGLPLWVDLHVSPADRTPWPTDSRVVLERRPPRSSRCAASRKTSHPRR
jgi:nucleotidyltransferase-like protein